MNADSTTERTAEPTAKQTESTADVNTDSTVAPTAEPTAHSGQCHPPPPELGRIDLRSECSYQFSGGLTPALPRVPVEAECQFQIGWFWGAWEELIWV